jgi:hypothetical protein
MKAAAVLLLVALFTCACQSAPASTPPAAAGSGDAAFSTLATFILKDRYKRHPSFSTDLGIHAYDVLMDDASKQTIDDETAELTSFKQELEKIEPATLTPARQLDREQLLLAMDAGILANTAVRGWAKDPTSGSGIQRRLRHHEQSSRPPVIASDRSSRAKADAALPRPGAYQPHIARRVFTEIAIEQVGGNIRFFKNDAGRSPTRPTSAGDESKEDERRGHRRRSPNTKAIQKDVCRHHAVRAGADPPKLLKATEMLALPLDQLLAIAETDRARGGLHQGQKINAARQPHCAHHDRARAPKPSGCQDVANSLDDIHNYVVDRKIMTIPAATRLAWRNAAVLTTTSRRGLRQAVPGRRSSSVL